MSQAPSMPVFTDALLGDTMRLSTEEFGAYCLLLFVTWRNNGVALKDNEVELSRVCRVSLKVWRARMRAKLAPFFDLSGGTWRQRRLEKEWEWVARRAEVNRKNGSRGGRPKATPIPLKTDETANPTGSSPVKPNGNQTKSTHTHEGSYEPSSLGTHVPKAGKPASLEKKVYDVGKKLLGSGGQVTKLKHALSDDLEATMRVLDVAAEKSDPKEYCAAIINGHCAPETDWDAFYHEQGVPLD